MRPATTSPQRGFNDFYRAGVFRPMAQAAEQHRIKLCTLARGRYTGRPLPRSVLPGMKSIGFWDADADQQWGFDWHQNEEIEICFLETGSVGFGIDHQSYELAPGNLTVTSPWQLHRIGSPYVTRGRLHWLIFDVGAQRPNQPWRWPSWLVLAPHDLEQLGSHLRRNRPTIWKVPMLRDCFRDIAAAVAGEPVEMASRLSVLVNMLFLRLVEVMYDDRSLQPSTFSISSERVKRFLRELVENLPALGREWTVQRMADVCDLGTTQFSKYCRQHTNMAPAQYLTACRVKAAAHELRNHPDRAITEIALDFGFTSSQYFATVFQAHFGCPPSKYRKNA